MVTWQLHKCQIIYVLQPTYSNLPKDEHNLASSKSVRVLHCRLNSFIDRIVDMVQQDRLHMLF